MKLIFLCPYLWRGLPLLISYPWKCLCCSSEALELTSYRNSCYSCVRAQSRSCVRLFAMLWPVPTRLPLRSKLRPPPPPPHIPNSQIWFHDFVSISHGESFLSIDAIYYKISLKLLLHSLYNCHRKMLNEIIILWSYFITFFLNKTGFFFRKYHSIF